MSASAAARSPRRKRDRLIGKVVSEHLICEKIGIGGSSLVYRAIDQAIDREVAFKVLVPHEADRQGTAERFHHEAVIMARFSHPNLLSVYRYGANARITFMTLPLLRGGTLSQRLEHFGRQPAPWAEARLWLDAIAAGLNELHQAGMVHCDPKPSNVLFDSQGRALLSDFGLVRPEGTTTSLSEGVTIGSPGYMSPEQAMGQQVDRRADVYSLGCMAFELITGSIPYADRARHELPLATVMDPVPSVRDFNPRVRPEADRVLRRALAKRPEDRYAGALEFIHHLNRELRNMDTAA